MFLREHRESLEENYRVAGKRCSQQGDEWSLWEDPCTIHTGSKSERIAHPLIGILPGINLYSSVLNAYCERHNPDIKSAPQPSLGNRRDLSGMSHSLNESLTSEVKSLCCGMKTSPGNTEATIEFRSALMTYRALTTRPEVTELRQFLVNLSAFLNNCYNERSHTIEPFQKQLILHTFYFVASIKAPDMSDKLFEIFKEYFDLSGASIHTLQTFKQKSSVFLIPRRHGKTWIVVAIISILLTTIDNIHIGYVAHQKHVANSVFLEIVNTLLKWFPLHQIEIKKEHGVIIFRHGRGRRVSSLMCATCFNKNVSTPS